MKVLDLIEDLFPKKLACSWDKFIGLQIGSYSKDYRRVFLCLDITESVIDQAIQNQCDLIVAHHALWFSELKKIDPSTPLGSALEKLIKNNLAVYVIHTQMDAAPKIGLSALYAQQKGLDPKNCQVLEETYREKFFKLAVFVPQDHAEKVFMAMSAAGAGHIGNYSHCSFQTSGTGTFLPLEGSKPFVGKKGSVEKVSEIKIETLVPEFKKKKILEAMLQAHPYEEVAYDLYPTEKFQSYGVGLVGDLKQPLTFDGKSYKRIAVCTGSGGSLIQKAFDLGAELYFTGEANHHQKLLAEALSLKLILEGHRETEDIFIPVLREKLKEKMPELEIF